MKLLVFQFALVCTICWYGQKGWKIDEYINYQLFTKVSQNDTSLVVVKYDYNNSTGDTLQLDRRKQSIHTLR